MASRTCRSLINSQHSAQGRGLLTAYRPTRCASTSTGCIDVRALKGPAVIRAVVRSSRTWRRKGLAFVFWHHWPAIAASPRHRRISTSTTTRNAGRSSWPEAVNAHSRTKNVQTMHKKMTAMLRIGHVPTSEAPTVPPAWLLPPQPPLRRSAQLSAQQALQRPRCPPAPRPTPCALRLA